MTVRSTTIFTIFWSTLLEFQKVYIPIYKKLLIWGVSFFFNQTKFENPAFWFVSRSGIKKQIDCFTEKCKRRQLSLLLETIFNRRWHISTTPNTAKTFCTLKNQNLNPKKMEVCGLKTQQIFIFSTKPNLFSSGSNFNFSSPGNSGWPY